MFTLTLNKKQVHFKSPIVMGILNVTPDSFYNESRKQTIDEALFSAEKMLKEGAMIIDVGGQSTRPNSEIVNEQDELKRVLPVIEAINKRLPEAYISIDTYYSKVAQESVEAGATIVNDISGGGFDEEMLKVVGELQVPYICMHLQGDKNTMHEKTEYGNLINAIEKYFSDKINESKIVGIEEMILDIGFGFSKTIEQNFELIKELKQFTNLQKPLLVGVSRKSSIYKTLGVTANEALNGTTILNTIAIQNGAAILRVHDVKEALEVIKLCEAVKLI